MHHLPTYTNFIDYAATQQQTERDLCVTIYWEAKLVGRYVRLACVETDMDWPIGLNEPEARAL